MAPNRIGFHVNGHDIPTSVFREYLKSSCSHILLLNGSHAQIDAALAAGKLVVLRDYDPFRNWTPGSSFDAHFHKLHSPKKTVEYVKTQYPQYRGKNVYFIIGINEPTADEPFSLQRDWLIEYARLMLKEGYRVDLGGFAGAKTFKETNGYLNGLPDWDPLLRLAHENSEYIMIDIHDYTTGPPWTSQVNRLDLDVMRLHKPKDFNWDTDNIGQEYHIPRWKALRFYARQKGWTNIRYYIGEGIWDHMADLGPVRTELNIRYGMPEFLGDLRGAPSLRKYYEAIWGPEWLDRLYMDIDWLERQYPPDVVGIALFAMNNGWPAYNFLRPEMRPFVDRVFNRSGDMRKAELTFLANMNVRQQPNTKAKILRNVRAGTVLDVMASTQSQEAEGFTWLNFDDGWVAVKKGDKLFVAVRFVEDTDIEYFDFNVLTYAVPKTEVRGDIAFYTWLSEQPGLPRHRRDLFVRLTEALTSRVS